jgi:hypothetical protein
MSSVCLIDTSILCELLNVPKISSRHMECVGLLEQKIEAGEILLLPMVTIFETGNHIGQNGDGAQRWRTARLFVKLVEDAIKGTSPFIATPFFEREALLRWLGDFPDWAKRIDRKAKGSGLGDLAIAKEFEHQCQLNPGRRVYVWSLDSHLAHLDRAP